MNMREILGVGAVLLTVGAAPVVAVAQTAQAKAAVDSAKAAGIVGEQADGFLGFVSGAADPALKSAVAEINAGRAQVYQQAGARSGANPQAAGETAFVQVIMPKLKSGEYYRPHGGGWVKKP